MMIKRKISDHHGRIENVKLFNIDPQHIWKEEKEREQAAAALKKELAQKAAAAAEAGEEIDEEKNDEEEKKDPEEEEEKYKTYDTESMTLFDIFGEYGTVDKKEVDENPEFCKTLFYDFTPYNSKDPVLLSLMTHKDTY